MDARPNKQAVLAARLLPRDLAAGFTPEQVVELDPLLHVHEPDANEFACVLHIPVAPLPYDWR